MPDKHPRPGVGLVVEIAPQPFGQIDRTVLAAGTANTNRQIVAIIADETRQPGSDKTGDIVAHAQHFRLVFEKGDYRRITAGQRTQRRFVMRIRQTAHVEHQLAIQRNTVLEAEGLNQQGQTTISFPGDELAQPFAQGVWLEFAGIDVMTQRGQSGETLAFLGNRLTQGLRSVGQRVTTPGFRLALEQGFRLGVEEHKLQIVLFFT